MQNIQLFQVDAFADRLFSGNPAAICPLTHWLEDALLQNIAAENNLSETAYFVPEGDEFHLRWFTPADEVKLCGHATLAAAHVLFNELGYDKRRIVFNTLSGKLSVTQSGEALEMDFPVQPIEPVKPPDILLQALGIEPGEVYLGEDYIAVFETEQQIQSLQVDYSLLSQVEVRGLGVSAPGDVSDFVSRFFAPRHGINEDPVTGSLHCALAPYWASRLGKNQLNARQLSKRGGSIQCNVHHGRVSLSGKALTFMRGSFDV